MAARHGQNKPKLDTDKKSREKGKTREKKKI
jgi:hypothetical protein